MTLPRVDWFRVFTELDRAGYRLPLVSTELGIPYSTLVAHRNYGAEPRHQDGDAIVRLWQRVTGKTAPEDIPRAAGEPLSAAKSRD